MSDIVLAARKLARTYTDVATKINVLRDINIDLAAGEIVAIVGSSGSGKSTLLHLLGGLDKPTQGQVILNGKNIHALSENEKCQLRNRHLGFVYQFHHLLPEFSALENVSMPLLIQDEDVQIIEEKAQHILTQIGLKDRMQHRLSQLSGGERQRVAIARALINQPLCVLADEPTGNLDPKNAEKVLELFFHLQQTFHTSIIMVTHDHAVARQASRILLLEDGVLVNA